MSYIPDLIIKRTDLEKHRQDIENKVYALSNTRKDMKSDPYYYLDQALKKQSIKFPEIELVIIEVDLTSVNMEVRRLLYNLNISFQTSY